MEEKNGFLKFQKNRLRQSRDIMRYVGKSPLGGALDREMYEIKKRERSLAAAPPVCQEVTLHRGADLVIGRAA